jgi:predicted membrane GTPase involved in stress response
MAAYGLNNARQLEFTFIEPSTPVYQNITAGFIRETRTWTSRCAKRKSGPTCSSTTDIYVKLTPLIKTGSEDALNFIAEDKIIEVTLISTEVRKQILLSDNRYKQPRDKAKGRRASKAEPML